MHTVAPIVRQAPRVEPPVAALDIKSSPLPRYLRRRCCWGPGGRLPAGELAEGEKLVETEVLPALGKAARSAAPVLEEVGKELRARRGKQALLDIVPRRWWCRACAKVPAAELFELAKQVGSTAIDAGGKLAVEAGTAAVGRGDEGGQRRDHRSRGQDRRCRRPEDRASPQYLRTRWILRRLRSMQRSSPRASGRSRPLRSRASARSPARARRPSSRQRASQRSRRRSTATRRPRRRHRRPVVVEDHPGGGRAPGALKDCRAPETMAFVVGLYGDLLTAAYRTCHRAAMYWLPFDAWC